MASSLVSLLGGLLSAFLHRDRSRVFRIGAPTTRECVAHDVAPGYNGSVLCPNDSAIMHQVQITSHYGQPIILDQCTRCGGIWFDESELFRAKQGEAEKVEHLDQQALRTASQIENSTLICPRDRAQLFRFTDEHFPESIVIVRCPSCGGIWLNKGEFTEFQKARQQLRGFRKDDAQDKRLREYVIEVPDSNQASDGSGVLGRLGKFLSTELPSNPPLSMGSPQRSNAAENTANIAVGVLLTLLRVLLRI